MLLRLLRIAARYPLSSLALALAAPCALGYALLAPRAQAPAQAPARAALAPADAPDLIGNRIWFDSYPDSPKDKFSIWLFTDEGYGVYRHGTGFRFVVDLVEYERKGDRLAINVLEENKKKETRFSIRSCDEKPPFDLCLTFASPVLGSAKFYGFKDSDQLARRMPWLPAKNPAQLARLTPSAGGTPSAEGTPWADGTPWAEGDALGGWGRLGRRGRLGRKGRLGRMGTQPA